MFLYTVKSILKSFAYIFIALFAAGIVMALAVDGFKAHFSMQGLMIFSCVVVGLLSIFMFIGNYWLNDDMKTAEKGVRKKGKANNMPWEFYQLLQKRKKVKAEKVYICLFVAHWLLAIAFVCILAVYYSKLERAVQLVFMEPEEGNGAEPGVLILVLLLCDALVLQFLYPLSMIHGVRNATCPGCGCVYSGMENYDYDFDQRSGTDYFTETYDVKVGTLKAGDTSVDVYGQQTARYKQDYTVKSHKTKCACVYCGHKYDKWKSSIDHGEKIRY